MKKILSFYLSPQAYLRTFSPGTPRQILASSEVCAMILEAELEGSDQNINEYLENMREHTYRGLIPQLSGSLLILEGLTELSMRAPGLSMREFSLGNVAELAKYFADSLTDRGSDMAWTPWGRRKLQESDRKLASSKPPYAISGYKTDLMFSGSSASAVGTAPDSLAESPKPNSQ